MLVYDDYDGDCDDDYNYSYGNYDNNYDDSESHNYFYDISKL